MAAKPWDRRENVAGSGYTKQRSGPPSHFFKIIYPSILADQKLEIPSKFVKKFGDELSEVATVTVSNGRTWQLGLKKAERAILFVDGWQEFVEYHSIDSGYFLLFGYQGFSKFNVCIFDKTATEIDYPCHGRSSNKQYSENVEQVVADDDHDEISEQYTDQQDGGRKRKKLDKRVTSLKCKAAKRSKNCELEGQAEQVGLGDANRTTRGKMKIENGTHCSHDLSANDEDEEELMIISKSFYRCRRKPVMSKETERAFHAARTCKHTHPCFLVLLRKRNVACSFVDVPGEFVMKYMRSCSEFINIQSINGKQWQMKCRFRNGRSLVKRISGGWSAFKNEFNLKEGDICVFELIKQKGTLLRASIYHAADYADPVKKRLKK
ncbi:B3 domain-containing transcription factor VRN1 [Ziziphus jujuba]|uniref:B3 domain-containing transcription factor VRN1 n=1 Tax=Ziziphus jujuba TaxID=326968 RepID=A0A6P3ZE30_ZIZJJ|nr:B3 domain-containing transcription factor VRN1 [Ziziphus jujuba]